MAYTVTTLAATGISSLNATLNGAFTVDAWDAVSLHFHYRVVGAGVWTMTDLEFVTEGTTYAKTIAVAPSTNYEFKCDIAWPDGGLAGITLTFTSGADLADRTKTVKDITTLEALRNIEMTAQGRLHVNESGNLVYESRFKRSL
jgi:hypothetical protein